MDGDDRVPFVSVTWQGSHELGPAALHVAVEDDDRLTDRAEIVFDDAIAAATLARDQTVRIDLGWQSEHAVLFDGVIASVDHQAVDARLRTHVTCYDHSYAMNREARTREFTSGTVTGVVRTLAGDAGLTPGTITAEPDPELSPAQPLRQTNVTDLVLLQDLARLLNARAFVEWDDDAHASTLHFVPEERLLAAPAAGTLTWAGPTGQLVRFAARQTAGAAAPTVAAVAVDPATGEPRRAPAPAAAQTPPVAADGELGARLDRGTGGAYTGAVTAAATTPPPADPAVIRSAAGLPSDPARAALATVPDHTARLGWTADGVAVGTVMLRAKSIVAIEGVAPWAAGDWYVRRVEHAYHDGDGAGGRYESRFRVTR